MDFDNTVHRDNLGLYTKLYQESPYIPSMEEGFSSSSSNGSSRIVTNNLDHFMVENPLNALYCSSFYDPFDPFQANSFGKFNQDQFSTFGQEGAGLNPYMHGCQSRRFVNGDSSRTGFQTVDHMNHQYQMNEMFDGYFEKGSSCLNDDVNQNSNDQAKMLNKRKRIVDKKSEIIKGQWTPEEDGLLVELVEKHGIRKWSSIAQMLPGRIGKQCRERWHNHLKPNIKKDRWSEEEDRILIEAHRQVGNRWAEIARSLPGRSENTIKNHWNATKRRQLSSRKNNNSKSNNTPLQDYIKSVMMLSSSSDDKGCLDNSSSSSTSPVGSASLIANSKQVLGSCLKPKIDGDEEEEEEEEEEENFKMHTTSLESQMHVQFDIQKEMDFMEMLSYGYI